MSSATHNNRFVVVVWVLHVAKQSSKCSPLASNKKTTTCEAIKTLAYLQTPGVYSGHPAGKYSSLSVASLNIFVKGAILSEGGGASCNILCQLSLRKIIVLKILNCR